MTIIVNGNTDNPPAGSAAMHLLIIPSLLERVAWPRRSWHGSKIKTMPSEFEFNSSLVLLACSYVCSYILYWHRSISRLCLACSLMAHHGVVSSHFARAPRSQATTRLSKRAGSEEADRRESKAGCYWHGTYSQEHGALHHVRSYTSYINCLVCTYATYAVPAIYIYVHACLLLENVAWSPRRPRSSL